MHDTKAMIMMKKTLISLCLLLTVASTPTLAADVAAQSGASDARRAQSLLQRAVARMRIDGDKALAVFSHQGEFADKELYVYVLDVNGVMLSSGGSSTTLVGQNVSQMKDVTGKPFFAEILEKARKDGRGEVEYRWTNWVDNTVQRKHTFFERVDKRIIAVGYYQTHATPAQARAFLQRAVQAMNTAPQETLAEFEKPDGRFIEDDLYIFVVNAKTGRFVAHGAMPRMRGTAGLELRDKNGVPIIQNMMAQVHRQAKGELEYLWKNPLTQRTETKHTLFEAVGDNIIAVGYYKP